MIKTIAQRLMKFSKLIENKQNHRNAYVINWESQRDQNLKAVAENLKRHISKSKISIIWFHKGIQAKGNTTTLLKHWKEVMYIL